MMVNIQRHMVRTWRPQSVITRYLPGKILRLLAGVAAVCVVMLLFWSLDIVPQGETGIVVNYVGVESVNINHRKFDESHQKPETKDIHHNATEHPSDTKPVETADEKPGIENQTVVVHDENVQPIPSHTTEFLGNKMDKPEVVNVYTERREFMLYQCQELGLYDRVNRSAPSVWHNIDHRHRAIYCPIPKVASSFFRMLIGMTGNMNYPDKRFTHRYLMKSLLPDFTHTSVDTLKRTYQHYKTAMFVRDPWWRLYSAYINKIYMPQVQYWEIFGKQSVRLFRKNASAKSLRCGDDATFAEFIKLVIHNHQKGHYVDLHLVAYEERCSPCQMKYEMIGKLETFLDDVDKVSNYFNISGYMDSNYSTVYRLYEVEKMTREILEKFNSDINKCLTMNETVSRLWMYLKLRGRIDPDIPPPRLRDVTHGEIFRREALVKAVLDAVKKSKSPDRDRFKKTAFRMAYQMLHFTEKGQILKIYQRDFELFGYEQKPHDVFRARDTDDNIKLFAKS